MSVWVLGFEYLAMGDSLDKGHSSSTLMDGARVLASQRDAFLTSVSDADLEREIQELEAD